MMNRGLVSIIMLSHNKGEYVRETVESVLAQTYQNWEIVVKDDSSKDDTISQMMELRQTCRWKGEDGTVVDRIQISKSIQQRGFGNALNSGLKDARGKWIAFLNVGDVWEPTKLEKQVAFMEEHDYAFSYTKLGLINEQSESRGIVIGGKTHVTYDDMLRCCWPSYLTVMYDAEKIGKMKVKNLGWNNDYALWLNISEKADCYLLDENLAGLRMKWNFLGRLLLTDKMKWRYEVYRIEQGRGRFMSACYTLRNMYYGLIKWRKYVKRG